MRWQTPGAQLVEYVLPRISAYQSKGMVFRNEVWREVISDGSVCIGLLPIYIISAEPRMLGAERCTETKGLSPAILST